MTDREIIVNALRYDRSIKRSWSAGLVNDNDGHIVVIGRFSLDVRHDDLGDIAKGTVSIEHFWLDRWSNVFCFYEPDGRFRNYYCNIALPPTFDGQTLEFVDLDLDVVVWPGEAPVLLDEEELEVSRVKYQIDAETIKRARREADSLMVAAESGEFPFDRHFSRSDQESMRSM